MTSSQMFAAFIRAWKKEEKEKKHMKGILLFIWFQPPLYFCLVISLSSVGTRSTCVCLCVVDFINIPSMLSLSSFSSYLFFSLKFSLALLKLKFSQQLKHIPYNIPALGMSLDRGKKKTNKTCPLLRVPHSLCLGFFESEKGMTMCSFWFLVLFVSQNSHFVLFVWNSIIAGADRVGKVNFATSASLTRAASTVTAMARFSASARPTGVATSAIKVRKVLSLKSWRHVTRRYGALMTLEMHFITSVTTTAATTLHIRIVWEFIIRETKWKSYYPPW